MKRMFPEDCAKQVEGGIEISMKNVISPIAAKDLPEDVSDFINSFIDGEPVDKEVIQGLVVRIESNSYGAGNTPFSDLNDQTIPLGGTMTFFATLTGKEVGEEQEIIIDIRETKFNFQFSRVVQYSLRAFSTALFFLRFSKPTLN
jgi:hypothetical protein